MPYSSVTKELLKHVGINIYNRAPTSPISLRLLCTRIGLQYKKVPMSENTCGMMVRSSNGPYIAINANHPYTRRRFSTAHEIGHFVLGHKTGITIWNKQNHKDEVQANKYASSLLMPDELFVYIHKRFQTIKDMAVWFRVSEISVAIRCMQFGIRHIESEFVKSEYYRVADEIAASSARSPIQSDRDDETRPAMKLPRVYHGEPDTVQRHNEKMLDRYRRMYGFE